MRDLHRSIYSMNICSIMKLYVPYLGSSHQTALQGRHILWGWLQERRKVGSYDYAGCLSVPRILSLRGDRLVQEPVPEVSNLRRGQCWKTRHLSIAEEEMTPLEGLRGSSLDIEVVLDRSAALIQCNQCSNSA